MAGRRLELAKLFYTLEADSKGLEGQLVGAERSFGRLADFVKRNPVAALTGLGTAALAAGLKLSKMAEETNQALGIIRDRIPGATASMKDMRRTVDDLAIQYGVSQERILGVMDAVSRSGVKTVDELEQVTRAAVQAGRATGEEFSSLVGGLDASLDIFGLSAQDATSLMAQLFSTAQGRTSLVDLLDTVQKLAPAIQGTGLDFLTTNRALGVLIDAGFEPGKKVIAEFTERLRVGGVGAIQALAAQAPPATEAMDAFTAAIDRNTTSIEANETRGQATLRANLVEIGSLLEPLGRLATKTLYYALGGGWRENRMRMDEAARQADITTGSMERLAVAGGTAAGAAGELTASMIEARNATTEVALKSTADLNRYKAALDAAAASGRLDLEGKTALIAIEKELIKRREEGARTAQRAAEETARAAREAAEKYAAGMKRIHDTLIQSTATLVDDTQEAIRQLAVELKAAGVSGEDASRALRPLNEQLALIRVNERFDLPEILQKSANAFTDRDVHRLVQAQQELDTLYRNTTRGSNEQLAVERQREAVQDKLLSRVTATTAQVSAAIRPSQELKELAAKYGAEIDEHGRIVPQNTEKTARLADKVREVALGAIGVAEGFGLVDSKAASALKSMVGIADSLPKALSGDPSAIFSVLGGLTGVIGSLFSGNSAEERARKELIRKNTEALTDLIRVNGNLLRVSTPGFKLAGAQDALAGLDPKLLANLNTASRGSAQLQKTAQEVITKLLRESLATQGLTLSDLDTVAKDLGIDIRTKEGQFSFPGLTQLLEALRTGQFTRFADEIQEQFERIQNAIEIGLINPADELAEVVKVLSRPELGKGVPAIAEALKGLDLATESGKAEGIKRVQALFEALSAGTLDVGSFGGLSGKEFRDVLVRLFGLLGGKPIEAGAPSANETGEGGGGGGASSGAGAAPGPTDPLVDQLVAPVAPTLGDLLGVNTETRDYVARLLEEVTSGRTLEPPVVPAGFLTRSAPAGSTVSFGDLHITVQVGGTTASADDIARTSAEAVQRSLDEYLERARARERLIRGDGGLP